MIGIGIIGCGSIGRTHAAALRAVPDARIVACCDTNMSHARALAESEGARCARDAAELLDMREVHAVYVCTRHDSHAGLAETAAAAGKHIYMEKPLALTREDCDRIGDAVVRHGVRLMSGFNHRFHPSVRAAAAHVPEPRLTIAQLCDEHWPDDFWANDPVEGGGNVLSQGCHIIDLVCALNGASPVRVQAEALNQRHAALAIIDTLVATLSFANGALASVVISDAGASPLVSKWSLQLMDGAAVAHVHERFASVTLARERSVLPQTSERDTSFADANAHFVRCLITGENFRTGFEEGRRATIILLRAFEAARSGRALPLDDV